MGGAEYAADFNKTEQLGGVTSTLRTADQTAYAHFWADVPGNSVTPPGHWDEIAENVSLQKGLALEQNAHLFGILNIGLADAAINCWNAKYVYDFWRPVTAINDPNASLINPATNSDPTWSPLWKTPNFPSYTSGHSTFSGAADAILTATFGANTSFTIGSDDMPGYTRSFTSFTQAANEAGESRVVGGIHFEFDNQAGLTAGREIGSYIVQNFLYSFNATASLVPDPNNSAQSDLLISGTTGLDLIFVYEQGGNLIVNVNGRQLGEFQASDVSTIVANRRSDFNFVFVSPTIQIPVTITDSDENSSGDNHWGWNL